MSGKEGACIIYQRRRRSEQPSNSDPKGTMRYEQLDPSLLAIQSDLARKQQLIVEAIAYF